ncbi:response regulator [Lichenihabitans sp. Uapishka_5]|uniref:response regulator transcription factor n=1 Tax=Lichenihabitans sp. Uapishka_5 TaxID=3037302 RepID=UPI0029E808D7|nr:response regulator [Lichenihabitans sp. Uapishka_5]MDX7951857.1 response regulator [Lichenihabitans sp. Uapishka_5]
MAEALPKGHAVAIVDDDPAIRAALDRLTRSLGFQPILFESAEALLSDLQAGVPGCIVTDVQMPGLGGLDLLKVLMDRGVRVPVIVVTAYPSKASHERALALGAFAYFAKPFEADHFERCLLNAFGETGTSRR